MSARAVVAGLLGVAALAVPAAGVSHPSSEPAARTLAAAEGKLTLLEWPGYSDPGFAAAFEERTGCRITRRTARSSAQMVDLMQTGGYDLVSASGDVSGTLISRRLVRRVDVGRLPSWRSLAPPFRSPAYNTVDGVHYGVTVTWTPNLLLWNAKRAKPAPAGWRAIYDERFRGKVSVPDNPMQIADAALYLRRAVPRLRIRDPYALTPAQFDAAVAILRRQHPLVARYWGYASDQIQDFRTGAAVVGPSWPYQAQFLQTAGLSVRSVVPREGATAWADSWLLGRRASHPRCAYLWMQYVLTAPVQAQMALALRESPVNPRSCPIMDEGEQGSCARYYASAPAAVLRRLAFWRTPEARCGGQRRPRCVPYERWRTAWAQVVG